MGIKDELEIKMQSEDNGWQEEYMEKKEWRDILKILLEWEREEILLAERVKKAYSGKARDDIYLFIQQELDKAREEVQFTKEELELIMMILEDNYTTSTEYPSGRLYEKLSKLLKQ